MSSTALQTTPVQTEVAIKLDHEILSVLQNEQLLGFQKVFLISQAIEKLKEILTPEVMKPIMNLQGNKLGFKTDRDKDGGYPLEVVKNCMIEAVLTGAQPFNNQFNIIAGNMYITKEGFGYLLDNMKSKGLSYEIIPQVPKISADKASATCVAKIKWIWGGKSNEREIEFPIKSNAYVGSDGVIGKCQRKARKWLYEAISGIEVADGDAQDVDATVVSSAVNGGQDKISEHTQDEINKCLTEADLATHWENNKAIQKNNSYIQAMSKRKIEIKGSSKTQSQQSQQPPASSSPAMPPNPATQTTQTTQTTSQPETTSSPVAADAKVPNDIANEIALAEGQGNLEAIQTAYPQYAENEEFQDLLSKQRIRISGKQISNTAAKKPSHGGNKNGGK